MAKSEFAKYLFVWDTFSTREGGACPVQRYGSLKGYFFLFHRRPRQRSGQRFH